MEYEIYYLCNLLGVFLAIGIVLFHFVEADKISNKKRINAENSQEQISARQ
jgi:hypothetical protein